MHKQKTIRRNNSTLKFDKKSILKINKEDQADWTKDLYDLYVLFSKKYSYVVKPIAWKTGRIFEMEKLDIVASAEDILSEESIVSDNKLHDLATLDNAIKIIKFYNQIYIDCLEFSVANLPNGEYFFHNDLNLSNIVFTSDNQIKLIDPDSFKVEDNFLNITHKSFSQGVLLKAHILSERLRHNE